MDAEQGCCQEEEQLDLTSEEERTKEISLQALAGTFNPRTLCLKGSVRGRELTILIDSGSTHNFIQDSVAYHLGIGMQSLEEFKAFISSGDYLVCREVCRHVLFDTRNSDE